MHVSFPWFFFCSVFLSNFFFGKEHVLILFNFLSLNLNAVLVNIQQIQDKLKTLVLIVSWVNTKPHGAWMVVLLASGGNMQEHLLW
jgi:hypothetical protein